MENGMKLTRRDALALGAGAAVFAVAGGRAGSAWAGVEDTEKAVMEFTGGATPASGRITLDAPEIAENGNTVPISVSVESPLTDDDYVASVLILAEGNPNPDVATLHFTPMSGAAEATTRMRLAKTQNVIAVAKMSDGSVFMDKKEVKVTIGGCGG
jgi:sulfur-oxidizing protein SoxY